MAGCTRDSKKGPGEGPTYFPLSPYDTPIKVRGGALAFYSDDKWIEQGSGPSTTYCANVKSASVAVDSNTFDGLQNDNDGWVDRIKVPWTIKLSGRGRAMGANVNDYVNMAGAAGSCTDSSDATKFHVTLSVVGGSFYDLKADRVFTKKHLRRFKDMNCDLLKDDEDLCERIDEVNITYPNQGSADSQPFKCPDMDCSIFIGVPATSANTSR
jgi:hypothetical protein